MNMGHWCNDNWQGKQTTWRKDSVRNKTIHRYLPVTCIKAISFSVITFICINNLWWNTDHSHRFLSAPSDIKQRRKSPRNLSKFHNSKTDQLQPLQHISHVYAGLPPNPLLCFHYAAHFVVGLCLDSHISSKNSEGNRSEYGTAFEHQTYHK